MVKFDIVKSYDKISWKFMRRMLTTYGIQDDWVEWIMNLVSSSLFSILVNGVSSGLINPSSGIIKGDPLFVFLLILMVEGLGRLISSLRDNNDLIGLRVHGKEDKQTYQRFCTIP